MNNKRKFGAALVLLLVLALVGVQCPIGLPWEQPVPREYQTKVYFTNGGDKVVVASGGEIEVQSGGTIDIQSGATTDFSGGVDLDGAALTLDAAGADTLQAAAATTTTLAFSAATDKFNVTTGNIKVGNGINGTTLDGEDVYIEGTLEVDGVAYLDGGGDLNGTALTLDAAGADTLRAAAATTTTLAFSAGGDIFNITTGSVKLGNGIPSSALNGEDLYVEGTLEADGAVRLDGAVTANSTLEVVGTLTADGNAYVGNKFVYGPVYVVPITATMTPTSTFYICTPAAQATWTLGTSGIAAGTELIVYNTAAQDLIIAHTNMLSSSGAALTINQYDLAAFIFNGTSWVEMYLIANS